MEDFSFSMVVIFLISLISLIYTSFHILLIIVLQKNIIKIHKVDKNIK